MHDLIFQTLSIIIGGAVLGIGAFICKLLIGIRGEFRSVVEKVDDHERVISSHETRIVTLERKPSFIYPCRDHKKDSCE